ncbi:MAG: serine hydrolase domain-containing protein [Bacteroidota bacterium]|nr:serine hydrolase domain-containing protein [Bacteroidota bacterium]
MNRTYLLPTLFIVLLWACANPDIYPESYYSCSFNFNDSSQNHPRAAVYQEILDRNRKAGIVGAAMMIKDSDGVWIGASGKADIASGIDVAPCSPFLIASISKSFTAATIMALKDDGLLSLDDPVTEWVDGKIAEKLENVKGSTLRHLLNHTSGIPDYYTLQFELDRINREDNGWTQEEVLAYAFGKKATNAIGETYYYSNTNYLLLGMIIEKASGLSLQEAYEQKIFIPAGLSSAYYSTTRPIPPGTVKGYVDIYGNGQYVESEFLYRDELNTADGGIAINAYDLGLFFEKLLKGDIISEQSLAEMTAYEDLPSDWVDEDFGHFQNGLGLEHNRTPYGNSSGHTGGIDGFLTIAQYFPEHDATFILLVNSGSYENQQRLNIYRESLKAMFDE